MHVTRIRAAGPYEAPGHAAMHCLRLQGHEAGPSSSLWVGLSHILPGGGTTLEASPLEKMYVVLAGEVTVRTDKEEATLGPWDSCRLAPAEPRQLLNRTTLPASILLVMPYPPKPEEAKA